MALQNSVLADTAYSEILNMILSAEIKPSERIREDLLAAQLGISRTPVREAVNRLTQNGFITHIKRKGLYCVNVKSKDLLDLCDLRIALESLSFEKCIDLATEGDLRRFCEVIDEFYFKYNRIIHGSGTSKEVALLHNRYDVRFHVGIAEISRSTRLIKYISEVENLLLIARQRIYNNVDGAKIILLSWKQHELMMEALKSRDKAVAKDLLEQHLMLMKETQVNINYEGLG